MWLIHFTIALKDIVHRAFRHGCFATLLLDGGRKIILASRFLESHAMRCATTRAIHIDGELGCETFFNWWNFGCHMVRHFRWDCDLRLGILLGLCRLK